MTRRPMTAMQKTMSLNPARNAIPTDPPCEAVAERLPWLLNDSLPEQEQRALRAHLATCESCRGELDQTLRAWDIFGQHVPSLTLAEYAQGLAPEALTRERIERHLALCPSCREELALARTDDRVLDFAAAPRRRAATHDRTGRWRALALAASVATVVITAVVLWSLFGSAGPMGPSTPGDTRVAISEIDAGAASQPISPPRNEPSLLFQDDFESGSMTGWSSP